MKVRILHVAQAAGGVDRYLRILLKYFDKKNFENIVVGSQDFKEAEYEGLADTFETVKMQREISIKDLLTIFSIRKLIKKYNPDIVYAHSSKAGAITRLACIGMKIKCVYNAHGWAFDMNVSKFKKYIYIILERILALFCCKIICISKNEYNSALKNKICKKEKLEIIYNGIDIDYYRKYVSNLSREKLGILKTTYIVGMVGRLCDQKAPDIFIKAANIVQKEIKDVFFIFVGDGPMHSDINKYAVEHGFQDKVLVTGWVKEPMDYIKLFNTACLFSRWEGFGLVLPEYMIANIPIVATKAGAIPEILDMGNAGKLIEVDDFKNAAKNILEIHKNVNMRKKYIKEENYKVKLFDAKKMAEKHMHLFKQL